MIALDANGADGGPAVVAEGARLSGLDVTLFGRSSELGDAGTAVVDCPDVIANEEDPALAARSREGASIVRAARAVKAGEAEALVSAGSTGAALAAGVLHIKRIRGVHRPALAVLAPIPGNPTLLLDVGANVDARPEHLVQFAYMGAAFMEAVHGLDRPRVGLLSVGEEPGKGTEEVVAAHERLAGGELNFIGNVEGLTQGRADVIVADGFTGNVALKTMEGAARAVTTAIREEIRSSPVASAGGLLIRGKLGALREQVDPNTTGGAMLLGVRRPVVIAHGSSNPTGVANAVKLARRAVDERLVERMTDALRAAGALRSAPVVNVSAE